MSSVLRRMKGVGKASWSYVLGAAVRYTCSANLVAEVRGSVIQRVRPSVSALGVRDRHAFSAWCGFHKLTD
jgi:hypothetical protein